jgi:hypothetical protein
MADAIDIGKELRLIRKALQSLVALQRSDARRVAKFEREAKREQRIVEKIRNRETSQDWIQACNAEA